jgi:translation initiation factor 1
MNRDAKLVYSSHPELIKKTPEAPPEPTGLPPLGQIVKIRREKNGRAGKTVTTLFEFQASDRQRGELAKLLRRQLGCGGTLKGNVIELQGDQLEKALAQLAKLGYKPLRAGG